MSYSPARLDQTKKTILLHAAKLFRRHGYNGVSINGIMADAGLTRGGFYTHFRSKEDLFANVLGQELGFTEQLRIGSKTGGRDAALRAVDYYLDPARRERIGNGCTVAANAADIARASRGAKRAFNRAFEALVAEFEELANGQDTERRDRALAAIATCIGAISLARALHDPDLIETLMATCRSTVVETLCAPN